VSGILNKSLCISLILHKTKVTLQNSFVLRESFAGLCKVSNEPKEPPFPSLLPLSHSQNVPVTSPGKQFCLW
jgi:hypothetical protein